MKKYKVSIEQHLVSHPGQDITIENAYSVSFRCDQAEENAGVTLNGHNIKAGETLWQCPDANGGLTGYASIKIPPGRLQVWVTITHVHLNP